MHYTRYRLSARGSLGAGLLCWAASPLFLPAISKLYRAKCIRPIKAGVAPVSRGPWFGVSGMIVQECILLALWRQPQPLIKLPTWATWLRWHGTCKVQGAGQGGYAGPMYQGDIGQVGKGVRGQMCPLATLAPATLLHRCIPKFLLCWVNPV